MVLRGRPRESSTLPGLYFWPWNFDSGAIFFIVILIQQADCYLDSVYNFSHFSFEVLQDRLLGAASGRSGQREWGWQHVGAEAVPEAAGRTVSFMRSSS